MFSRPLLSQSFRAEAHLSRTLPMEVLDLCNVLFSYVVLWFVRPLLTRYVLGSFSRAVLLSRSFVRSFCRPSVLSFVRPSFRSVLRYCILSVCICLHSNLFSRRLDTFSYFQSAVLKKSILGGHQLRRPLYSGRLN